MNFKYRMIMAKIVKRIVDPETELKQRNFSSYDTSQIEPELGISLDELNRRIQDTSRWKPLTQEHLDELKKISKERRKNKQ